MSKSDKINAMHVELSREGVYKYVVDALYHNIRRHLHAHGKTQGDVAEKLGMTANDVSHLFHRGSGSRGPTVSRLAAVALVLGTTMDELCGLDRLRVEIDEMRRKGVENMENQQGFETHRCDGSLKNDCSIRKYPADNSGLWPEWEHDGTWNLFVRDLDMDWDYTYMEHVAPIEVCPFCGERLEP